jgi:hypothetical protein
MDFWEQVAPLYLITGGIVGGLGALVAFFGVWIFGANQFGTWAFILGWVPGGVMAFVLFWLLVALWPIAVVGLAVVFWPVVAARFS